MHKIDLREERMEILRHYAAILRAWSTPADKKDKEIVRRALNLAIDAHKDMRRKSGEPYIYHPLSVAYIVTAELGLGTTSIVCALLHDVVEDTEYSLADIEGMFGQKVASIIDGLTKIRGLFNNPSSSAQAENFKKILLTLSNDVRVILIKLADRLHNMRTLDSMPAEKQLKIASETNYLYAPLAHRLGLFSIKSDLEDLALKYTEPEIYQTLSNKLLETEPERNEFIRQFIYPINKALGDQSIKFEIFGRTKSIYSIWQKMKKKEVPFEEVYDLFAIRVIIDTILEYEKADCWRVYSIVTDFYRPNLERLRDWISFPKANGYEALHTTLMSHTGKWVEIQIRTKRMNEIAEKGYAAHWKYKEEGSETSLDEWLAKVRDLLQGGQDEDALDFLSEFKLNLFTDEIYVFTPKGDMKNLPSGSTALDFAYNIHTQIGNSTIGAKVNYRLVSLGYVLRTGDQVEIITSKKQRPREDWLKFVVTARARSNIKDSIKEERKEFFEKGKEQLLKLFKQVGAEYNKSNVYQFQQYLNITSLIDLYYCIATDKIGVKEVKECCQSNEKVNWLNIITRPFARSRNQVPQSLSEKFIAQIKKRPEELLLDPSINNIDYEVSKCCNPIPGDDVIGMITYNEPISIHRINCPEAIQLMSKYGNRIVKAKWTNTETIGFLTGIKIISIDKPGLLNEITKIITEKLQLNIRSLHIDSKGDISEGIIMLYVYDTKQLNGLLEDLKKIDGIRKVSRIDHPEEALS